MQVQKLRPNAKVPTKAHPDDAGWDFYAAETRGLRRGEVARVPLGVAATVPEGHVMILMGRSSLAAKGVIVLGGVIDPGYRGELVALLLYTGPADAILVVEGDRVVQGIVAPMSRLSVEEVMALPDADRGEAGFGSSGR